MSRVDAPSENPLGACPVVVYGDPSKSSASIIVIQEWWGMNQYILDTAKEIGELAKTVTLVPDLYRGKVALDREQAGHYSGDLNWDGAVQDLDACVKYLKSQGVNKIGVTGFCQGGALTIAAAARLDNVDAAVAFYGIPRMGSKVPVACNYKNITCPLQCHFGEKDQAVGFSSRADYEPFHLQLREAGVDLQFYTYDAGHAFANPNNANFNKEFRDLSFSRMIQLFHKHLGL